MYHDAIAMQDAEALVKKYGINTVFETGSYHGRGTLFFSSLVPVVVSCDIDERYWNLAASNIRAAGACFDTSQPGAKVIIRNGRTIVLCHGNSPTVLHQMLSSGGFAKPYLFYLDAHWNDYWPLLDEIREIAAAGVSQSVIIIHDIKVPGKDFGYDTYKNQPLDLDYVKPELLKVNPDYKFRFNEQVVIVEPSEPRGILYVTPD